VVINWTTATETNNRSFEIERSEDKTNFNVIGFVDGNGTTTEGQNYSFIDKLDKEGKYYYRLKQIDFDGSFSYSNIVEINYSLPVKYSLSQNYPNPFNPSTKIEYSIPKSGFVSLKVYDLLGREIVTLVSEEKQKGKYEIEFDAAKYILTSGIYFYSIKAGAFVGTKKLLLLK